MSEYPQKRSEAQQGTSHDAAGGSDDSDLGRPQDARVRVHYRTFEEARATKKKYSDVDGAYFGTSFPHIFLQTFNDVIPK